jgi:hypothetical protein
MSVEKIMLELTLLLHIWEVPGLILGTETGYPDMFFMAFPQSLQANAEIVPHNYSMIASFQILSNPFTYHQFIWCCIMFRVVFWDILPCKMIVDNHFTRQYIPEEGAGLAQAV